MSKLKTLSVARALSERVDLFKGASEEGSTDSRTSSSKVNKEVVAVRAPSVIFSTNSKKCSVMKVGKEDKDNAGEAVAINK